MERQRELNWSFNQEQQHSQFWRPKFKDYSEGLSLFSSGLETLSDASFFLSKQPTSMQEKIQEWNRLTVPPIAAWQLGRLAMGRPHHQLLPMSLSSVPKCRVKWTVTMVTYLTSKQPSWCGDETQCVQCANVDRVQTSQKCQHPCSPATYIQWPLSPPSPSESFWCSFRQMMTI